MKVWLKKKICGSHEQYMEPTADNILAILKGKKKKEEEEEGKCKHSTKNAYPNTY